MGEYVQVTPEDARRELERRACMRSFSRFCQLAWPVLEPETQYVHNWHIEVICDHLQAAALWFLASSQRGIPDEALPAWQHVENKIDRAIRRLVINIPPRHMKSIIVSILFNAWIWTIAPHVKFFSASYAQGLSDTHALKALQVIRSEWYQSLFGATGWSELDETAVEMGDRERVRIFETTQGGQRLASSVMGQTTGAGGDFLICDDPHNVIEKDSELKVAKVVTWWSKAMSTRGNDPKRFVRIIVMQRVSESDLAGWAIEHGYDLLLIPARYEGKKQIGVMGHEDPRTENGEPLWAERFGDEELKAIEVELGPQDSAGQLQQRPQADGGGIFKMDKLRVWTRPVMNRLIEVDAFDEWVIFWDFAHKSVRGLSEEQKKKRSWNCGQLWARRAEHVFLIDQVRFQGGISAAIPEVVEFAEKHPQAHTVYIEEKAMGPEVMEILEGELSKIEGIEPKGSKKQRAEGSTVYWRKRQVWVPDESVCEWVGSWRTEHELFPVAAANDQVDTTSMAVNKLLMGRAPDPYLGKQPIVKNLPDADAEAEATRARIRAQIMRNSSRDDGSNWSRNYTDPNF